MAKLARCLVGGTFDRFHAGHKALLLAGLDAADFVEVWIANDQMSSHKSEFVQSFEQRRANILDWADERISTHELSDNFGPAAHRKDCDGIICTPETLPTCNRINETRLKSGLTPLEIIEAPHILDQSGTIISSSRIRAGTIDSNGGLWLGEQIRKQIHHFVPSLDEELKQPMGDLHSGPEDMPDVAMTSALQDCSTGALVAVGDVCVATLLEMEITPDIALIDGQTKRIELVDKVDIEAFDILLSAVNPAGKITPELIDSIEIALASETSTCIEVDGEEDLAPIIIHLLGPIGTNVIYGQPNQGVVLQITDKETKVRCKDILSKFEVT